MSSSAPHIGPASIAATKPSLITEMFRLWLEHHQRMIAMRAGPF